MWKLAGISSLGRVNLFIGVYLLSLIRSRKSSKSHVGAIPTIRTKKATKVDSSLCREFFNNYHIISRLYA